MTPASTGGELGQPHHRSMGVGYMQEAAVRLPQDRETELQLRTGALFSLRYAYARSAERRRAHHTGQDYLAFSATGDSVVFALCDGVGESFYGDVAARFLGDRLLLWMATEPERIRSADALRPRLDEFLHEITSEARPIVEAHEIPQSLPPFVREVLEDKRAHGSESVFACGRITRPPSDRSRITLAWMGNCRIRLFRGHQDMTHLLSGDFTHKQRWSSALGPLEGPPHLVDYDDQRDERIDRVLVYSDGLSELDGYSEWLSDASLSSVLDEGPAGDDLAVLEVSLGPRPAALALAPLPPPDSVGIVRAGAADRLVWSPVPGAQAYRVEVRLGRRQSWPVAGTSWHIPPLAPGTYQMRVRAVHGGNLGRWSDEREVSVAAPPPLVTVAEDVLVSQGPLWRGGPEPPLMIPAALAQDRRRARAVARLAAVVAGLALGAAAWMALPTIGSPTQGPQAAPSITAGPVAREPVGTHLMTPATAPSIPPAVAPPADRTSDFLDAGAPVARPSESPSNPSPSPDASPASRVYVVLEGDSLASIARAEYGDESQWTAIYEANIGVVGADPRRLEVGVRLVLPDIARR